MLQTLLGKWIAKKGGVKVLLIVGDLIVKTTKSKKDDELWQKIKPIIKKYK
jgi:chaperonin cofactor prefoldin